MKLTPSQEKLVLIFLFIILFGLEVVATQHYLTSQVLGANDFYTRWYGAKVLLLDGRDPYSLDVTAEILPFHSFEPDEMGRASFAYPLHVIFLFLPLIYLPYDWAQGVWLVMLQWVAVGMMVGLIAWKRVPVKPAAAVGLLLAAIFFYPVARTILLGQFTIHVTFFVVMTVLLLDRGRDAWAGVFLAATSIKPQMVIFIGPWLVLWAIGQKRWRFVAGLLGGGVGLFLISLLFFPRWPISFIEDILRYSEVAGGSNPLDLLLSTLWPGYPVWMRYLITIPLIGMMLLTWWQGWQATGARFERALFWTIVVGVITTFQTGTTNLVLLVIPLFVWLLALQKRWGVTAAIVSLLVVELFLWTFFFTTIRGDFENPLLFLPLPLLALSVLITQEWQLRGRVASPPS